MPQHPGPLTDDDLEELKVRLTELDEADRLIEQAVRAGIEITEQQTRTRELRERLMRIRQSFFPGR